jgi:hypothetical protein
MEILPVQIALPKRMNICLLQKCYFRVIKNFFNSDYMIFGRVDLLIYIFLFTMNYKGLKMSLTNPFGLYPNTSELRNRSGHTYSPFV